MDMMRGSYKIAAINRIIRKYGRGVFRLIYRLLAKVRISGLENIPATGPYIIVFNHVSIYDPPFLITHWTAAPEPLGASDTWNNPIEGIFFRLYGGIVLDRSQYHRSAVEKAITALEAGEILLMAPEGRLSKKPGMQQARPGIAFILEKMNVPVIPVGVVGTTVDFIKRVLRLEIPTLELRIGEPISVPPIVRGYEPKKQSYQRNTDLIMAHIAALLPPDYRGYYHHYEQYMSKNLSLELAKGA